MSNEGRQCGLGSIMGDSHLRGLRLLLLVAGVCGAAIGCASTPSPPVTPDLIQVVATTISSGGHHTCALLPDGSPVCWGANDYSQAPGVFTPPPKLTAITSGGAHTCGLGADGSWTCWGSFYLPYNSHHMGHPPRGPRVATPDKVGSPGRHERFVAISTGLAHACALGPNGEAVCWGDNRKGQASPFEGKLFRAISSGESYTCALRFDGSPVCWSWLDWTSGPDSGMLIQCPPLDRPQDPLCSKQRTRALEWLKLNPDPGLPPEGLRLEVISSGGTHTCALRLDGSPVCWGWLQIGPLEDQPYAATSIDDSHTCKPRTGSFVRGITVSVCRGFEALMHERFVAISSGWSHTCALRADGSPVCWGFDRDGQASPPADERFVAISSGRNHTCALRADGSPVCWGDDQRGQASPPDMRFAIALGEGS